MSVDAIKCPKCGTLVQITEVLKKEVEGKIKMDYERDLSKILTEHEEELKKTKFSMQAIIDTTLLKEREQWNKESENKFKDLEAQVLENNQALEKARENELELRKQQRKLEDDKRNFELEMNRKLDEERTLLVDKAKKEADDAHRFIDMEKDKKLGDMLKQIEDLKRKAEQQSQQTQGEALELEIENSLKAAFPSDIIEPIAKGVQGADVVQIVNTNKGMLCGKIIWEVKRTKAYVKAWQQKIKDDMRTEKADIAVIITAVMPTGMKTFGLVDGVWVVDIPTAISLASALRYALYSAAKSLEIKAGKESKSEEVYNYLTGGEFKNRIQAIVEAYITMKSELDAEKRAITLLWSKREKQLERVSCQLSGMHGDLEGIVGG